MKDPRFLLIFILVAVTSICFGRKQLFLACFAFLFCVGCGDDSDLTSLADDDPKVDGLDDTPPEVDLDTETTAPNAPTTLTDNDAESENETSPTATQPSDCEQYKILAPSGSGVVRRVTNQSSLQESLKAARPGDTVNLAAGEYEHLDYRNSLGHASGTVDNPIIIQAELGGGVVFDRNNISNNVRAGRVMYVSNVQVRGIEFTESQFGLMAHSSENIVFEYNRVYNIGHSGIIANADYKNLQNGSDGVTIRCNEIFDTGKISSDAKSGEGIYIGYGSTGLDPTSNVLVEHNNIYNLTAEAVDVKASVTNVTIRNNNIHDLDFKNHGGAAITVGTMNVNYPSANVKIEDNSISNLERSDGGTYYGMIIGHGGVTIRNNVLDNVGERAITFQSNVKKWGWGNPNARDVSILDNTISGCSTCLNDLSSGSAIIEAKNNKFTE